ncbi:MAG: transglutaminase family protein [Candidatus Nanoarchaeia archaeon]
MDHEEEYEDRYGPLRWIGAVFLLLLLVVWLIPLETIPLNPEPSNRLSLSEAIAGLDLSSERDESLVNQASDYVSRVDSKNQFVKTVADRIVSAGCGSERICHAKALFYFVRDELNYVSDPSAYEYVKGPLESLQSTAGDCDDASVLLASMLGAVGIKSRFVFVPGHVYVEAYIPDAPNRYTQEGGWIVVDGTCSNCKFGELALAYAEMEKKYTTS